jgi:hypothetical protein
MILGPRRVIRGTSCVLSILFNEGETSVQYYTRSGQNGPRSSAHRTSSGEVCNPHPKHGCSWYVTVCSASLCLHLPSFALGIHIFMAFYGLSVFLETLKHMRKGRKRYIATSFVITCFVTFAASLDMARYFQVLFQSTSPSHWQGLARLSDSGWQAMLSHTGGWILVWIGDILLVS